MSRFRRPSPAMVVAIIALIVALAGGAYAASKIGTKQLKNNAVTKKKIRNGAVTTSKLANGAVTDSKLAAAAKGLTVAYATVNVLGQVVASESSGPISTANVNRQGAVYCFHGLSFPFKAAAATPLHADNEAGEDVTISVQVDKAPFATNDCDAVSGAQLEVLTSINNTADTSGFVVEFLR